MSTKSGVSQREKLSQRLLKPWHEIWVIEANIQTAYFSQDVELDFSPGVYTISLFQDLQAHVRVDRMDSGGRYHLVLKALRIVIILHIL